MHDSWKQLYTLKCKVKELLVESELNSEKNLTVRKRRKRKEYKT